jgi:hypothetical protein
MACVGLKVTMSIAPLNCIKDYWNSSMFLQQQDLGKVLSHEVFEVICANIVLHDPEFFNHEQGLMIRCITVIICSISFYKVLLKWQSLLEHLPLMKTLPEPKLAPELRVTMLTNLTNLPFIFMLWPLQHLHIAIQWLIIVVAILLQKMPLKHIVICFLNCGHHITLCQ